MSAAATKPSSQADVVRHIGDRPLTIDDVVALSRGAKRPALSREVIARMKRSADVLARLHEKGDAIYGVTTSVGASVDTVIPPHRAAELSLNVLRMHGCGTGRILDEDESAAVLIVRLSSLAQGMSGIRPEIAERLVAFLEARVLPRIPSEGSVGASGDLTPLSYVAAALVGEREMSLNGEEVSARVALESLGIAPMTLRPKEALALMNGTSVATALACLAWYRARRVARVASTISAMASLAVNGNRSHFDSVIHAAKPHPGQMLVAGWIREDLAGLPSEHEPFRLQDRYSVRCAPHVIGVLVDALRFGRDTLETELNGVSDNPIVDVENERLLHGGNFYGGHVGFVADSLKIAVANIACLIDRQVMLMCNPRENDGLPADLVGVTGPEACTHNGFKAVTIAASSLAAEAMKNTMPASAFSRSTELHNQDKVPMATTASRDLLRILDITEQVVAMGLLAACQAYDLRGPVNVNAERIHAVHWKVRDVVPRLEEDRRMDLDIKAVLELIRNDKLPLGVSDLP